MKHTTLLLTLLASAPLFAKMSYDEAQQRIDSAQSRLEEVRSRIDSAKAARQSDQKLVESVAGKHEYADEIRRRTEQGRVECEKHKAAVESEIQTAVEHLQAALSEVGPQHKVAHDGTKYYVEKPQPVAAKPAPIVQRAPVTRTYTTAPVARTYATTTTTRLPYETRRTRSVARSVYSVE